MSHEKLAEKLDLDEEWDPEKHDAQMRQVFDDDYYNAEDEEMKVVDDRQEQQQEETRCTHRLKSRRRRSSKLETTIMKSHLLI